MLDFTKKVVRKGNEELQTCFVGFNEQNKVVLQNGPYGIPRTYDKEDFEHMFYFIHDEDEVDYKQMGDVVIESPVQDDEVCATNNESDLSDKEEKQDTPKKEFPVSTQLKNILIDEKLTAKPYFSDLKIIECKDGSLSYRYRNVTVLQVKGKRKVAVYMTGKLLEDETFAKFLQTPEHHKATHNAYVYLNSADELNLVLKALDESVEQIDIKKDGDRVVPINMDIVHE